MLTKQFISIKPNGLPTWHYELAVLGGLSEQRSTSDICEYMKHVALGVIYSILFILAIVGIGYMLISTCIWIYVWITIGHVEPGVSVVVFVTILIIGILSTIVTGIVSAAHKCYKLYTSTKKLTPLYDNFLKCAYNSLKYKMCFKIEFTNTQKK